MRGLAAGAGRWVAGACEGMKGGQGEGSGCDSVRRGLGKEGKEEE